MRRQVLARLPWAKKPAEKNSVTLKTISGEFPFQNKILLKEKKKKTKTYALWNALATCPVAMTKGCLGKTSYVGSQFKGTVP